MNEKDLSKYRCENCCNFDKDNVLMDGHAKCKATKMLTHCDCVGKECRFFDVPVKNIVVLPCLPGDKVSVKALCECVRMIHDDDYFTGTGAVECPFENGCEFEDCDNSNERYFSTFVDCIYNNGEGWKIAFDDLGIEASFKDKGISFFPEEKGDL